MVCIIPTQFAAHFMVAYSVGGVHKMLPLCCISCILCMVAYCGSTKHACQTFV